MKTLKIHNGLILLILIQVLTLFVLSCSHDSVMAEPTASITAWELNLYSPSRQPMDLILSNQDPDEYQPFAPFHVTQLVNLYQQTPEYLPELDRTQARIDTSLVSSEQALTPWLVNDDLTQATRMNPQCESLGTVFRRSGEELLDYEWFTTTAMIDNDMFILAAVPAEGLVEACVIADYYSIEEFNNLAHEYFNLSEEQVAVDDYRPTRFAWTPLYGPNHVHPNSYETVGYVININEPDRTGYVRSFTREFISSDTNELLELTTLELSLKYTECIPSTT